MIDSARENPSQSLSHLLLSILLSCTGHGRPPAVLVGEDAKLLLVSLRELDQLFADQGFALLHWCLSNAASELEGRLSFDRSSE